MTDNAITKSSAAISVRAARLSITAAVKCQVLLIALIFIRPDLDPSWHTISGLGILLICAIGTVGAGIFTTDPLDAKAMSTIGLLHITFGSSALALLPFAALLINLSLSLKNSAWLSARRVLLWTSGLPPAWPRRLRGVHAIFVVPMGPHAYGPGVNIGWPPRFAFFTYMLWLITLAWQAIRAAIKGYTVARAEG